MVLKPLGKIQVKCQVSEINTQTEVRLIFGMVIPGVQYLWHLRFFSFHKV